MRKLIVANWKMNPASAAEAKQLFNKVANAAKKLRSVETVICPPFVWLPELYRLTAKSSKLSLGGQDVFWEEKGAYTGEISTNMLKDLGVKYVIIGHSERRQHLGETDEMVNKKILAALKSGLRVILCIGESLEEHRRGETRKVLGRQLKLDLKNSSLRDRLTIAYEPIWAIGTAVPETPFLANEAAKFIRKELLKILPKKIAQDIRIIYGGSVNSGNIFGYLVMSEISGALVGSASLDTKNFEKILGIANLI